MNQVTPASLRYPLSVFNKNLYSQRKVNAPLSNKRGRYEEKDNNGGGKNARPRTIEQSLQCPRKNLCRDFLHSLNLDDQAYFNTEQDRCYCQSRTAHIPNVLEQYSQYDHQYDVWFLARIYLGAIDSRHKL